MRSYVNILVVTVLVRLSINLLFDQPVGWFLVIFRPTRFDLCHVYSQDAKSAVDDRNKGLLIVN